MFLISKKKLFRGQKTQKSMMQSSQQVLYSTTNSHNIFASKNAATNQSLILNKKMPSTKAYNERLMMVESKLLNLDCYQRAYKTKNNLKVIIFLYLKKLLIKNYFKEI